jgi:outer membrane protein OmpA-like peptidoglycan-associated protein
VVTMYIIASFARLIISSQPGTVIGKWQGKYDCLQGLTGLTLYLNQATPAKAQAVFHFFADTSNPSVPSGCFSMTGGYDPKSGKLKLIGEKWIIQPKGYITVNLDGVVDPFGNEFTGKVAGFGCKTFTLHHVENTYNKDDSTCGIPGNEIEAAELASEIKDVLLSKKSIDLDVAFQFSKSNLLQNGKIQLDELGRFLSSINLEHSKIAVYGHTDGVGKPTENLALSDARANTVAEYLNRNFGIARAKFEIKGFGYSQPKAPSNPSASENRRVEIRLIE